MKTKISLLAVLVALSELVSAHPGHGNFQDSPLHYTTSAWHVAPVVALVAILIYAFRSSYIKRRKV